LNLGFVPITEERYDLAVPEEFLSLPNIGVMLEVIGSDGFRERVQALGGYDTRDTCKRII